MKIVKITEVKPNPKNPRIIKDDKFRKLVKSIQEFPDMLNKRPLIVFTDTDGKYVVLGGNMRLKACNEIGLKEIPVILADEWTEEQKAEFLIKDNVGFGEWDWDQLANEWDAEKLDDWGLDLPIDLSLDENEEIENIDDNPYSTNLNIPIYETNNEKPALLDCYNKTKYVELINEIDESSADPEIKDFLKIAASRHIIFDYEKIADLYAHSEVEVQNLFEKSALVIIDYNKAIENGFINLSSELENITKFINE